MYVTHLRNVRNERYAHVIRSAQRGALNEYPQHVFSWRNKKKKLDTPLIWNYVSVTVSDMSFRKHAYSNILKILPPKNENFQIKNSDIFHISAQNIDCWYSLEPPQ